ncbi:YIP1 family protein [Halobaculum lipolyticum]|uniref:YIP1 family protein n=1 Tax=Halobaculum lipolyticum TaxID=3032001 RepID=A0ABD5WK60_9EURY|nr:YIP1 family protein [Halobaculum sp. DT31]
MPGPRTPLLRPHRYFEAHDGSPPVAHALAAVAVVTLVTAGGVAVFLGEFAAALDVPVTVDNPAYPGDPFCENTALEMTPAGCDEPATVERDLGALVAAEYGWLPGAVFLIVPLFWLLQGAALHAGSAVAGGEGAFGDTLVVAGWGLVPSLVRVGGVGALLVYRIRTTPLPGTADGAADALAAAFAGLESVGLLAAGVVAVWAGAVRLYGLAAARDLSTGEAAAVVGALTLVGLLAELF